MPDCEPSRSALPEADPSTPEPPRPEARIDPITRFCYGIGSVAYGVKDNGFGYFLLYYYNQVLGLPGHLASLAIFIALLVDAISDPIVGTLSDRLHSRWGRRHPFMYAAALPVTVSFYFLWNPPSLAPEHLFYYLLVSAILVRSFLTLFEIPSTALAPELTDLYDERTTLASIRHFFGWVGGITIAALTYYFLLVPTDAYPIGQMNPRGYELYGLLGGAMMLGAILLSSVGTHGSIARLKRPPAKRARSLRETLGEIRESLSNRSFLAIFFFGIFTSIATGFAGAMSIYIYTHLWALQAQVVSGLVLSGIVSAIVAAFAAPALAMRVGKKRAAMAFAISAGICHPMPVVLRLLDLAPANGTSTLLGMLFFYNILSTALIISAATLVSAMMADIVEESELRTGRRSEGIFFAARSFITKSLTGFGIVLSTILLGLVDFPTNAQPGQVAPEIIWRLGAGYAPFLFLLFLFSLLCLGSYRITREQHEANVEALEARLAPE